MQVTRINSDDQTVTIRDQSGSCFTIPFVYNFFPTFFEVRSKDVPQELDFDSSTVSLVHQFPMRMFPGPAGMEPQRVHVPWAISELTHIKSMMPSF